MPVSETPVRRILLFDTGDSGTSGAIVRLRECYTAEIVSVVIDLGQGGDLERLRDEAVQSGAARAHVLDLREQFAGGVVLSALKADAVEEDGSPLGTSLEWPFIARQLMDMAHLEHAFAVALSDNGVDAAQAAIERMLQALDPALEVIALPSAASDRLPSNQRRSRSNVWGRHVELRNAEEAYQPPDGLFTITRSVDASPIDSAYVEIAFERGVPVAVNNVSMAFMDLISSVTTIAGAHGIGRGQRVRQRPWSPGSPGSDDSTDGTVVHELYEAPAAVALHAAHKALQRSVASETLERFSATIGREYSGALANGLWFTPLREALEAFVNTVQDRVTGSVHLRLFKGECLVVGTHSAHTIHRRAEADELEPIRPLETLAAGLR